MKYVPKSKLTKPKKALPQEFRYIRGGVDFVGEYVESTREQYFPSKGGVVDFNNPLMRVLDQPHSHEDVPETTLPRDEVYFTYIGMKGADLSYTSGLQEVVLDPLSFNYEFGTIVRYFAKHLDSGTIIEIGYKDYNKLLSKSTDYHWPSYVITKLPWRIAGAVADEEINSYIVEGVESYNKRIVEEVSENFSGIENKLTNYLEYHK